MLLIPLSLLSYSPYSNINCSTLYFYQTPCLTFLTLPSFLHPPSFFLSPFSLLPPILFLLPFLFPLSSFPQPFNFFMETLTLFRIQILFYVLLSPTQLLIFSQPSQSRYHYVLEVHLLRL